MIRDARDRISEQHYTEAIEVLTRATAVNPKSGYAYHLLGLACRGAKKNTESVRYLCEALQRSPADDEIRKSLAEGLKSGFPLRARDSTLRTLQELYYENTWSRQEFAVPVAVSSSPSDTKTYPAFCTVGTLFPPDIPQRDPLHEKMAVGDLPDACRFNRVTYVYIQDTKTDEWNLRCRIYYVSPFLAKGGKDHTAMSAMLGRIALQVISAVKGNLAAASSEGNLPQLGVDSVVNLWLCELGEAGAQQPLQAPGHIYFHDINRERPWAEWVREMAHEFGHMVIPPVGGFTGSREAIANGEIGERLFMPWIQESLDLKPQDSRADDRKQISDYVQSKTAEALKLFLNEGPESPLISDRGDWGIQYLAGFCLWICGTHDPSFLQSCLQMAREQAGAQALRAVDVRDAYQKFWSDQAGKGFPYHAGYPAPKYTQLAGDDGNRESAAIRQNSVSAYWVYLPEGVWEIRPKLEYTGQGVLSVSWDGKGFEEHGLILNPGKECSVTLEKVASGWHLLRFQGSNLPTPVRLLNLSFHRKA